MSRCGHLAFFVMTTTDKTDCFTPCACTLCNQEARFEEFVTHMKMSLYGMQHTKLEGGKTAMKEEEDPPLPLWLYVEKNLVISVSLVF